MTRKIIFLLLMAVSICHAAPIRNIRVAYDKTTHVVFPKNILYVDLGSETIMAEIVSKLPKILKIKATERNFQNETNLSVILEDERIYNFNVTYTDTLNNTIYYVDTNLYAAIEELEVKQTDTLLKRIYEYDSLDCCEIIGCRYHGVSFSLLNLVCSKEKVYIHLRVSNDSQMPFIINGSDAVMFSLSTKDLPDGQPLQYMESYGELKTLEKGETTHIVYSFEKFSLAQKVALEIQIYESQGSRHQSFRVNHRIFEKLIDVI